MPLPGDCYYLHSKTTPYSISSSSLLIRHNKPSHFLNPAMIDFRKLRLTFTFFNFTQKHPKLKPLQNPRFHSTKNSIQLDPKEKLPSKSTIREAQAALLEYLHSTRSLQFLDADNMCKNSPFFLHDLVKKTQKEQNPTNTTKRSISRYLRYHPINEFEPFFESVGLKPSEYEPLLPRDMIFLNDDPLLMENYHTLCYYGVPRSKMGIFFKQAPDVFRFENGVLISKLKAYENLGVETSTLVDAVAASPKLLVGDVNVEFVKVIEMLNYLVVKCGDGGGGGCWIEWHFFDGISCNWGLMLEVLTLFSKVDFSEEQFADVIRRSPCVVFEESGGRTLSMIGFLVKFGLSVNQIAFMFLEFPSQIRITKFYANLRQCFNFLTEIAMQAEEIGRIFQSHTLLLGSCTLKTTKTLRVFLNVGNKRLCKIIQNNPEEMKNWVLGRKVEPLANSRDLEEKRSKLLKTEFLLRLGYAENSKEMKFASKVFRGKGAELQERFDSIVKAGLSSEDVRKMIRVSPQILNQNTDRVNKKIEYLVNEGYPVSDLVSFPSYLSYTPRRVKHRLSMYKWLKDHGLADARLALSTIITCTDRIFLKQYVSRHPSGLQVWEDLKKEIYPEV